MAAGILLISGDWCLENVFKNEQINAQHWHVNIFSLLECHCRENIIKPYLYTKVDHF